MGAAETPDGLQAIPGIRALFLCRIDGVDVRMEKAEAMAMLEPLQCETLAREGLGSFPLVRAEQVHGNAVAWIESSSNDSVAGVDGLATASRGITLGISVADCAPVWIVARDGSAGALLHSGRKGTVSGIVQNGVSLLLSRGNLSPEDLTTVVGPCIRPPCYDSDFAAEIRRQALHAGIHQIHDAGICTACHPHRYYSYRRELGKTGRMLATLTLLP